MGLINKIFGRKVEAKSNYSFVSNPNDEVLNVSIAYNKYGGYCTPLSTQHRTLNQKILKGDIFEPDTIAYIISKVKEGDIIHAGTFFGDFLPGFSKNLGKIAKIWAFEPNPESYRCAQITNIINGIENVKLMNAGLGEKESTIEILVEDDKGRSLGGSSTMDNQPNAKGKFINIKIVAIDDIVPKDRNITILQLDVEGYEKQALIGALNTIKRCKPIIIIEDKINLVKDSWFKENILSLGYSVTGKLHYNIIISPE